MTSGRKVSKADLVELARALGDEEVTTDESMLCIFQRALDRARVLGAPATPWSSEQHPKVREWCAYVMENAAKTRVENGTPIGSSSHDEKWIWYGVYRRVSRSSGAPCEHAFAELSGHQCLLCLVSIVDVPIDPECRHKFVDSKVCLLCGVPFSTLQARHRWLLERLGATPAAACEHAGELAIDRATGDETCVDCEPPERFEGMLGPEDMIEPAMRERSCPANPLGVCTPSMDDPLVCAGCDEAVEAESEDECSARTVRDEMAAAKRRANAEQWAQTQGTRTG